MKKLIFALSALLLFLPALSIAEGEITVSGAALNAAQRAMMTSAEESVTISELLRWDNESYTTLIWHGMENGSPHFAIMDSETGFNYLLEDYAYRLYEVTGLPYYCVFTGTALADAKENLSDLLSIFDDETSYTFVPQADGTAVFSETYALDDDVFTDTYTLYADTLELVEFHAQVAAKNDQDYLRRARRKTRAFRVKLACFFRHCEVLCYVYSAHSKYPHARLLRRIRYRLRER